MKKPLVIALNVLTWTAILAYLVVSSSYAKQRKKEQLCREIRVVVLDSAERNFITPGMVRGWFVTEKVPVLKQELSSLNTLEIEEFVRRRGFVRTARVYTSIDGRLNIELTQRRPIARVSSVNGYNFYITDDDYILPLQRHFVTYVPVITGYIEPPFGREFVGPLDQAAAGAEKKVEKNYLFLAKLINFVKFVGNDDFWKAFIVQINVEGGSTETRYDPQVEIVPRAGNQIVTLGSIDGYREKLDKLMSFYRGAVAYEGWDLYRSIDLSYKDQIVCIK